MRLSFGSQPVHQVPVRPGVIGVVRLAERRYLAGNCIIYSYREHSEHLAFTEDFPQAGRGIYMCHHPGCRLFHFRNRGVSERIGEFSKCHLKISKQLLNCPKLSEACLLP